FEVVNLGIRVPSEQLIQAVRELEPDVIGLSGLLVKSAQQMVLTAGDLRDVGIKADLLVGGAALTRSFTHFKIAQAYGGLCTYAKDAMHGLSLVERLTDPEKRPALEAEVADLVERDVAARTNVKAKETVATTSTQRSSAIRTDVEVPAVTDLERHVVELDLDEVWNELNLQMLYGKHLGLRGSVKRLAKQGDEKLAKLEQTMGELKDLARGGAMSARAVWQFFRAETEGNTIRIFGTRSADAAADSARSADRPVAQWEFPRQAGVDGLCLADYVLENDHLAMFVTTAGTGVRDRVEAWKQEGEYLKSHAFASLAIETAEAAAELVHMRLREAWGFPDPAEFTPRDRFSNRYRGCRYSFGYPACPDLSAQQPLFEVLQPESIGVELTEGDMMDPEASVSALVFHHPDAKYFGV
ncbi:MAG: cobalamin-dependent protein, partial [Acidobacteria bacterium]|nr:cobalamin-dependent protein [Acidobacteriota bacterium]